MAGARLPWIAQDLGCAILHFSTFVITACYKDSVGGRSEFSGGLLIHSDPFAAKRAPTICAARKRATDMGRIPAKEGSLWSLRLWGLLLEISGHAEFFPGSCRGSMSLAVANTLLSAAMPASTIARPSPRELPVTNQTCEIHPPIIRNRVDCEAPCAGFERIGLTFKVCESVFLQRLLFEKKAVLFGRGK